MRISLKAADRLSLLFLALLGTASLLFLSRLDSWLTQFGTYLLLAAALLASSWFRQQPRAGSAGFFLHVAVIVALIFSVFNSMGDLILAGRNVTYDDMLIRIDLLLFGVHPTVWMESTVTPWLTAVMQFAYISYYFIPVVLGVTLIVRKKQREFEEALFAIALCFYLSYVGYFLVPAVGPRFTLEAFQTAGLQAGPITLQIQETLNGLERTKLDAFPSGHTAIALVTLLYAWKSREKYLFGFLLPLVLALLFSTVYLRYHYVIDVIAGVLLAAVTVVVSPVLERRFSGTTGHP